MTIYRDGKAIELTEEELMKAWNIVSGQNLKYDIEEQIDFQLECDGLSFESFKKHGYGSEDDFRSAFVEECFPLVQERMDDGWSRQGAIEETISDFAQDYELWSRG